MNQSDAGVLFKDSVTVKDLRSAVGAKHTGSPWAYFIDPKLLAANGQANLSYVVPQNTAAELGYRPFIYGPHWFNHPT